MDDLDSKAVAKNIEDSIGKKKQKLKDDELAAAFVLLQKNAEERITDINKEAIAVGKKFLKENSNKDDVITTASGLQYKIVKKPMALSLSLPT